MIPDVELITVDYLRAHSAVAAITTRVSTTEPARPTLPLLLVQVTDGAFRDRTARHTYDASVEIEAKAATRAAASLLARTALDALLASPGYLHHAGTVVDAQDLVGVDWDPDTVTDPPTPRFAFTVQLSTHT